MYKHAQARDKYAGWTRRLGPGRTWEKVCEGDEQFVRSELEKFKHDIFGMSYLMLPAGETPYVEDQPC